MLAAIYNEELIAYKTDKDAWKALSISEKSRLSKTIARMNYGNYIISIFLKGLFGLLLFVSLSFFTLLLIDISNIFTDFLEPEAILALVAFFGVLGFACGVNYGRVNYASPKKPKRLRP